MRVQSDLHVRVPENIRNNLCRNVASQQTRCECVAEIMPTSSPWRQVSAFWTTAIQEWADAVRSFRLRRVHLALVDPPADVQHVTVEVAPLDSDRFTDSEPCHSQKSTRVEFGSCSLSEIFTTCCGVSTVLTTMVPACGSFIPEQGFLLRYSQATPHARTRLRETRIPRRLLRA
jgi:hypothetical protein